ncbi:MAG: cysteine desulfurase-like protein [Gammaproteobacteria bacterium]|jgi:cysteine desulfurase family protein (TIGR01976 family)|nr:cysteine desulfurase-like protein [Gammaproteobacteria bacterium]
MTLDLEAIRSQFPALSETDDGVARLYFDNPAGTQVPKRVADAMSQCLLRANANLGGHFRTSDLAGAIVADAQEAMADFLNAPSPDEIIFGQNMTSLTFHVSRSIGRHLDTGDEIILSRMDHDANVEPWVLLARDHGLTVRWLSFDTATFEFDLRQLEDLVNERTRLICVCAASNLTGTVNDVKSICRMAREAGVWTYIDAVQSAPHMVNDVQDFGCDFLVCSPYKFFGPHQGTLWGRREVLETLEPYKVRPAPEAIPWCFAPGTASHEGMAGTAAAVDYFAWVGETMAGGEGDRRQKVRAGMGAIAEYEQELARHLVQGLRALPGITVQGITAAEAMSRRGPTVAFTHEQHAPDDIARALAEKNIFAWSGHNYAVEVAKSLGILESGGAVRVGPVHYNTLAEIDRLLEVLDPVLR